jgi:hypothetical protein
MDYLKKGVCMLMLKNLNFVTTRMCTGTFVAIVNLKHSSGILCIMYAWVTPDESAAARNTKIVRSLIPHLSLSHPFSCCIVSLLSATALLPIT